MLNYPLCIFTYLDVSLYQAMTIRFLYIYTSHMLHFAISVSAGVFHQLRLTANIHHKPNS